MQFFTFIPTATHTVLAVLFALLGFGGTVHAEPIPQRVRQVLDPTLSQVTITLESPLVQFSAKVRALSGFLDLDRSDLTRSKVEIHTDLAQLQIQSSNAPFDLEQLFKAISQGKVTFLSSSITRLQNGGYRIAGAVHRGQQSWPAQLSVKYQAPSGDRSIVTAERAGMIEDTVPEIPVPITPGSTSGSMKCSLVFRSQGTSKRAM